MNNLAIVNFLLFPINSLTADLTFLLSIIFDRICWISNLHLSLRFWEERGSKKGYPKKHTQLRGIMPSVRRLLEINYTASCETWSPFTPSLTEFSLWSYLHASIHLLTYMHCKCVLCSCYAITYHVHQKSALLMQEYLGIYSW